MTTIPRPSLPNYIPKSEELQLKWLLNYKVHLPILGVIYGLSPVSIAAALLAINGLIAAITMIRAIREWLSKWITCNDELQYDHPSDGSVTVTWPPPPTWMVLPDAITVNAWQPILETTKLFLAKSNLSALDKTTLLLDAVEPVKKRPVSAETLDYPLIKLSVEGGSVAIRTLRGDKYRGKLADYVIDYNNNGIFTNLTASMDQVVLVPIVFPPGVTMMTWTIRAVYKKNGQVLDNWCPPQSIVLYKDAPNMGDGTGGNGGEPAA